MRGAIVWPGSGHLAGSQMASMEGLDVGQVNSFP